MGRQPGTSLELSGGYTNPNAHCPVCGAPVYFYESPYGGRVFFDELGPPWPTHPCTTSRPILYALHPRPWQQDGWKPLTAVHIEAAPGFKDLYTIKGEIGGTLIQLYFRSNYTVVADIVRYKKIARSGTFLLSTLYYDPARLSWRVVEATAHTSDRSAARAAASATFREITGNTENKPEKRVGDFVCPWCDRHQSGHSTTITEHLLRAHGLIALGTMDKVSGFLQIKDMDPRQKARLEQIERAAIELFGGDRIAAIQWMHTPNKHLSMLRPATRVQKAHHLNTVLNVIRKLQTGEISQAGEETSHSPFTTGGLDFDPPGEMIAH